MKLLGVQNRTFGIGTNPGGGIMVHVQAQTCQERDILGTWEDVQVNRRLTRQVSGPLGGPVDGGCNQKWNKLKEYLRMSPLEWAKNPTPADLDSNSLFLLLHIAAKGYKSKRLVKGEVRELAKLLDRDNWEEIEEVLRADADVAETSYLNLGGRDVMIIDILDEPTYVEFIYRREGF